jgi:hypothetical protein
MRGYGVILCLCLGTAVQMPSVAHVPVIVLLFLRQLKTMAAGVCFVFVWVPMSLGGNVGGDLI